MKQKYQDEGYCIQECLFLGSEIDELNSLIYQFAPSDFGAIINPDRPDFLIAQSLDQNKPLYEQVAHVEKCYSTAHIFRKLMKNSKIVDIIENIHGKKMVALSSHMLFKQPGSPYAKQAWALHQDNSYAQNKNGELITINIFFKDAFPQNGTVFVYPKSHKLGILEYKARKSYGQAIDPGNKVTIPDGYERIDIYGISGDVLFMNGNCVHGSYANETQHPRPMFSVTYIAEGEEFLSGKNTQRKVISLHAGD